MFLIMCATAGGAAWAADAPLGVITADFSAKKTDVSPILFGAFFEDINYGADGGLYAEMMQNRSFEYRFGTEGWTIIKANASSRVSLKVEKTDPLNLRNPRYGQLKVNEPGSGVANGGYDGLALKAGQTYRGSVYLRSADGTVTSLKVSLDQGDKAPLAQAAIAGAGTSWTRFEFTLQPAADTVKGRFLLLPDTAGSLDIDMLSLFPERTFKDRPNGLRFDLAGLIAALKPGFFRFPGGCVVEGGTVETAYRWKDTIGPVEQRKENPNVWGYQQSYGIGFHEYFQYCEDIGAEPVPIINCGMACQARGGRMVSLSDLGEWIQDALDLIEYANGAATTKWGAERAKNGHPEPFNIKFLGIGNEQWGEGYYTRYQQFAKAIKAKYPQIKLIFAAGPVAAGSQFDDAWSKARAFNVDVVDEHYYVPPEWFLSNTTRYDSYDRNGPKVFLGEYAAHVDGRVNNLYAALSEAAYMTHLERNGDIVEMAAYAPLLVYDNTHQWVPDLIWFNNTSSYGTPSYYVQSMFANNKSDKTVPMKLEMDASQVKSKVLGGGIGLGTWSTAVEYKAIKVTDKSGAVVYQADSIANLDDWRPQNGVWEASGGSIHQTALGTDCRLVLNKPGWDEYTLTLKARKIKGSEGMLIMFGIRDGSYYWWNLGGWNNTTTVIEKGSASARGIVGKSAAVRIETDRWYDIKIELSGETIRCYLDGKLINELVDRQGFNPLYAHVGTTAGGDIVIKIVNIKDTPSPVRIKLQNAGTLKDTAEAVILSNPKLSAMNSFASPDAVTPKTIEVGGVSDDFIYAAEPNSLTVLRIKR
jgi:alpha-L-arabinofuranosidase